VGDKGKNIDRGGIAVQLTTGCVASQLIAVDSGIGLDEVLHQIHQAVRQCLCQGLSAFQPITAPLSLQRTLTPFDARLSFFEGNGNPKSKLCMSARRLFPFPHTLLRHLHFVSPRSPANLLFIRAQRQVSIHRPI